MVAQAEEVADGGEDGVGVGVVGLGDGRADGGAGVVEELVLEAVGHVGDGFTVGGAQIGTIGEEGGQLALANLVGVVAQLLEEGAGRFLVAEQGIAGGGFSLDDQESRIDPLLTALEVLLGLGTEIVDVVEGHLVKIADPGVEVAGDGDIQDQGQAIAAGPLDPDVLVIA